MSDSIKKELEGDHSVHTNSGQVSFSEDEHIKRRRIWRKVDLTLVPWFALLYLLSFLDRSNIGNARILGMSKDLNLVGLRYNTAAAVFFIMYCFVEIPSNIAIKLFRPSIWIPSLMVAWGTVMTLMCLVNSYEGLVIARIFLGLTEGGLFPGVIYYISLWYPRRIQAERISFLPATACVAGAFGGIFAYALRNLEGKAGLHGWQWIFLIEGLATVIIAFASFFLMHDYPETATFLTEDERKFILQTLKEDRMGQPTHASSKFVWQALTDWKTYIQCIIFLGTVVPVYSIALFMPTIIHALGFSAGGAQLLSVPPFVCAGVIVVLVGIWSDRVNLRGPFVVAGATIAMAGFILAYTTSKPGPGYAATVITASGVYPTAAVILAWSGGNAGGDLKKGVVIAMVVAAGNLGGICSSFIYYQPPRFHKGHGTNIGFLGLSIICSSILMWKYRALNKEKEELCQREGIDGKMEDKYSELGDKSPLFRYVI